MKNLKPKLVNASEIIFCNDCKHRFNSYCDGNCVVNKPYGSLENETTSPTSYPSGIEAPNIITALTALTASNSVVLDKFHYHEVLDRLYTYSSNVDEYILQHPVLLKHKSLRKRVKKAVKLLAEAYQIVGGLGETI